MEKFETVNVNSRNQLEQIKAEYNVGHEDFTTHYPNGIIVYRGSNTPPDVVFNKGFQRSSDPIWIEDSRYLLKDRAFVSNYVHEQAKLNRTLIFDPEHGNIVPPGATRGLISMPICAWHIQRVIFDEHPKLMSQLGIYML